MTIKEGYKVEMKPSQPANARVVQTADGFRCYITHLKIIEPLFDVLDLNVELNVDAYKSYKGFSIIYCSVLWRNNKYYPPINPPLC